MARFGGGKKSRKGKRKVLYTRVYGRQNAKRKPLLHGKGMTQTSYEAGFFDFLKVFWKNNKSMEICNLTKQVANAWEALLPKPKLSKKTIQRDYHTEFKILQQEAEKQNIEKEQMGRNEMKRKGTKKYRSDEDTGSETEASSRSNFDDDEESMSDGGRSRSDLDERRSQTDDESVSENTSMSQEDSESELESDYNSSRRHRRTKRKRNGRRYESYEAFLNARNRKNNKNNENRSEGNKERENNSEDKNSSSDQKEQEDSNKSPKDGVFFPIREITSFDRIVRNEFDDQNEMLRKLKLYGRNKDPDAPDNDDMKNVQSDDSISFPLGVPKFSSHSRDANPSIAKLTSPTDTLHVKNLIVGIRQPELQEIFRIFLNDIIMIRVLDNKFNGEAVVEFKSVEAAENVWRQMNGVEYKRLPLVLEFANKEDLI